jgi:hypothetical protein
MRQSNFVPILLMLGVPSMWALVVLYNLIPAWEPKSDWKSPQQCYDEHIRWADGMYPLKGDDSSKLKAYCERMYHYNRACDFRCEPNQLDWKFFTTYPGGGDRREEYLDVYFSGYR